MQREWSNSHRGKPSRHNERSKQYLTNLQFMYFIHPSIHPLRIKWGGLVPIWSIHWGRTHPGQAAGSITGQHRHTLDK
ncbi:hypothetical protein ATANTOWER_003509 [Ataeniobius toweri]|uniref:Uncharacterized protein n=1 Tax=Ataeniobius toweri TaxID=208326 RepID=A0ABU7BZT5_9TELE|nr:hypothetical protein [Ataeniobius toweri]